MPGARRLQTETVTIATITRNQRTDYKKRRSISPTRRHYASGQASLRKAAACLVSRRCWSPPLPSPPLPSLPFHADLVWNFASRESRDVPGAPVNRSCQQPTPTQRHKLSDRTISFAPYGTCLQSDQQLTQVASFQRLPGAQALVCALLNCLMSIVQCSKSLSVTRIFRDAILGCINRAGLLLYRTRHQQRGVLGSNRLCMFMREGDPVL